MDKLIEDIDLKNLSDYGNGTDIIDILNIGFEPLLTKREYRLHKMIMQHKLKISLLEYQNKNIDYKINLSRLYDDNSSYIDWLYQFKVSNDLKIERLKKMVKEKKEQFVSLLEYNIRLKRNVYDKRDFTNPDQCRTISIFESSLTRMLKCKNFEFSDTLMCIVTYYTEILDGIMHNGFNYKHNEYVFFTAGAGATRQKKSTFIRKDLLEKYRMKMFCGLTEEMINELGGMNTNKYLAYTSLIQSNTQIWHGFDIMKSIVVPDIEFKIPNRKVRHIYTSTPEDIEQVENLEKQFNEVDFKYKEAKFNKESIDKSNRKARKPYIDLMKKYSEERKQIKQEIATIKDKYYKCEIKEMDIDIPFTD